MTEADPRLTPYVGVRSYDAGEAELFAGRSGDVHAVADLVADKARWRLILLHGMTGAGKSSFLKAGLIPEVSSEMLDTTVYTQRREGSVSVFITAGADPLRRLAEAVLDLATSPALAASACAALTQATAGAASPLEMLTLAPAKLARLTEALAPLLKKPLLLVVDQAEEVFTLRAGAESDAARERFFDFLAAFSDRRSWIQILISMRTEFFGRYHDGLRRRLGADMPVAAYLLRALTPRGLAQVITAPCDKVFDSADGVQYTLSYEEGVPARIAARLIDKFPGPGALTALQIVCVRLVEEALDQATPAEGAVHKLMITQANVDTVGAVEDVIEDVVDKAIGEYCETRRLSLHESLELWRSCKRSLGQLVAPQAEGTPVTRFMQRWRFEASVTHFELKDGIKELVEGFRPFTDKLLKLMTGTPLSTLNPQAWPTLVEELTTALLRPQTRVLRLVAAVDEGSGVEDEAYVALGHDLLAVGLAEFMARDMRGRQIEAREQRVFNFKLVLVTTAAFLLAVIGTFAVGRPLFGLSDEERWSHAMGAGLVVGFIGMYAVLIEDGIRSARKPGNFGRLYKAHLQEESQRPRSRPQDRRPSGKPLIDYFWPIVGAPRLFRYLTAAARREHGAQGAQAFPPSVRY